MTRLCVFLDVHGGTPTLEALLATERQGQCRCSTAQRTGLKVTWRCVDRGESHQVDTCERVGTPANLLTVETTGS